MRVLLAATSTLPDRMGGSERVIWHLARGLVGRGHHVRIVVPRGRGELAAASQIDGIEIRRYRDRVHSFATLYATSLAAARRAIAIQLRDWRPDIVHAHHGISGLAARWAGADPRCYTFYGPWHLEFLSEVAERHEISRGKRWTKRVWAPAKAALARSIERAATRGSARAIVLSDYSRRQLAELHGLDGARVTLIPGGVDLAQFAPTLGRSAARKSCGLPPAAPILLTVRRLVPRMGLLVLLRALTRLPRVTLVIGGAGWLRSELESAAGELGVAPRVRFAGFIPDAELPSYYQAADLVVLPSVALEGFGLVALEALACGTPVVATADSGTTDLVGPLGDPWLASDATPETLATAIAAGLERSAADGALRERCRARAADYSWDTVVSQYEMLYRSLTSNR